MEINVQEFMASIYVGEDTELELKEVVFRGNRISLGGGRGSTGGPLA